MTLPTAALTEDNLPTYMTKQLGQPLTGDGELHLLAGMPLRPVDVVPSAKVTNAPGVQSGAVSSSEATQVQAVLQKKKASK